MCQLSLRQINQVLITTIFFNRIFFGRDDCNSQIVCVDEELSLQAGLLHSEMRKTSKDFDLANAYVLATARRLKAKILTGAHFKSLKEAIMIY